MKNLKKISILFFLLFALNSIAQSNKGFYASVNSGYNYGTGNINYLQSIIVGMTNSNEVSSSVTTIEYVKVNLGKGINVSANFGYMFNKNIGFEFGTNYLFGGKINASRTSYTGNYRYSEISSKMLQIMPTLVFKAGFDKINPYAKVGMVIASGKITNIQDEKDGTNIYSKTLVLDGGMPIGFRASIGTLYKLNEKLSLFGEINLVSLEYAPNKGSITDSTKNGTSNLSTLTVKDKEIEFVDNFVDTSAPSNPNVSSKYPIIAFSFSSIGLNLGLQYQF